MSKYSANQKAEIISRYRSGVTVMNLTAATGIPRSTIYSWLKDIGESVDKKQKISLKNYRILEAKVKRLETMLEIIKKTDCTPNTPLEIKLDAIESLQGEYSAHILCDALDVARGTYYNHVLRNKRTHTWYAKRREEFREEIRKIYDDSRQIYGAEKIQAVMKNKGYTISVRMVRELMKDMGIISIREGAKDYYDKEKRKLKNYLNQQFNASRPNEYWVSDMTCFRYNEKNFYICAIIDLYARMVVAYKIGNTCSTQLAKSTFRAAYKMREPEKLTFHTDRGSCYQSNTFRKCLSELGVTQSFSRAHIPYDNSVMESFFSNLKREELYRAKYRSEKEFRTAVDDYMTFYNEERPHAKNNYKTPLQKELDYYAKSECNP